MTQPRVGLYPGTFDPATKGHIDIIWRASRVVDRLVVGVAANAGKGPLFNLSERVAMVREEIAAFDDRHTAERISVEPVDGLLVQWAADHGVSVLIRGLRAVTDFEYEMQMASLNRAMTPEIETVFLMASDRHQFISSRFVKEIGALGGNIAHFVSPRVVSRIEQRLGRGVNIEAGAASKAY